MKNQDAKLKEICSLLLGEVKSDKIQIGWTEKFE